MLLDSKLRKIITTQESIRFEQNKIKNYNEQAILLKKQFIELSEERKLLENQIEEFLINQPNILLDLVPIGKSEADNLVIEETGNNSCENKIPHFDLIENLIMKNEAAIVSGTRFVILKNALSKLKNALHQYMLESNMQERYEEYTIPYLVNEECLFGTGQLPKFAMDAFKTTENKWLISTGEISLVNIWRDKIFNAQDLPKLCMTFSPCFRSEAGAAGKDTKGLIRLHQFHKLELVTICTKEDADKMHEKKLNAAKKILNALNLPYRVLLLCGADTGFTATKQYDIEIWMPGMQRYLEVASCSQCGNFQAIRANIRYRNNDGKLEYAHTLNGSSLPIERLLAAIIENYWQYDRLIIPQILRPYTKFEYIQYDGTIGSTTD